MLAYVSSSYPLGASSRVLLRLTLEADIAYMSAPDILDSHDPRNAYKFDDDATPETDGARMGAVARWFDAPASAAFMLACGFAFGASAGTVAAIAARGLPF
jgi:hypothetical protein